MTIPTCPRCNGAREIVVDGKLVVCPDCGGTGQTR